MNTKRLTKNVSNSLSKHAILAALVRGYLFKKYLQVYQFNVRGEQFRLQDGQFVPINISFNRIKKRKNLTS